MSDGPHVNPDDYDNRYSRDDADDPILDFAAEEVPTRRQTNPNDSRRYPDGWNPDEAMKALAEEATILDLTPAAQAQRLMEEALPVAVAGLVHLSQFAETEKMRFDAQKYLIDRNLGTPTKEGDLAATVQDPLEQLVEDCIIWVEKEDAAQAQGGGS